jgi:hypothetical protein
MTAEIIDTTYTIENHEGTVISDGEAALHPEAHTDGLPYVAMPELDAFTPGVYVVNLRVEVRV